MSISDRSKTDFDRAKIKLTGHFDRRPIGRYIEPWTITQHNSTYICHGACMGDHLIFDDRHPCLKWNCQITVLVTAPGKIILFSMTGLRA